MPVHTPEQIAKREATLKKQLADGGESLEPEKARSLRKKIKRAQRKHRRVVKEIERRTAKPKKKESDEAAVQEG